jgi:hypothetical protein
VSDNKPAPHLTYLSLGAGIQSTALYLLADSGKLGKVDVAIFADTHREPFHVYEHLANLKNYGDIPIVTVTHGDLGGRLLERAAGERVSASMIPAFVEGADGKAAPLGRNCTRDHKIYPIQREVRSRIGKKGTATALIGISLDEAHRQKDSLVPWIKNTYPLVERGLTRDDCVAVIREHGIPMPEKSACYFCPYHSNAFWLDMKRRFPAEWDRCVAFDIGIRDMTRAGVRGQVFLHRSLKPLDEVDLNESQRELFGEECEGVCGV